MLPLSAPFVSRQVGSIGCRHLEEVMDRTLSLFSIAKGLVQVARAHRRRELPRTSNDSPDVLGAIELDRMDAPVQIRDGGLLALINGAFPLPAILGQAGQGIRCPSGMLPTFTP
jgi:hypothetical protein